MRKMLATYSLRKLVNTLVEASLSSPSLAEMVHHHLDVSWTVPRVPTLYPFYRVSDGAVVYWELFVTDHRGYGPLLYQRALALLTIGINGALATPDDEAQAHKLFPARAFRTCPDCHAPFPSWLDYYGHTKIEHLLDHQREFL